MLASVRVPENQTDDKIQHIKGNYYQWQIHLEGIKRMIELRGGIGTLDMNRELRLTIMWYGKLHEGLSLRWIRGGLVNALQTVG